MSMTVHWSDCLEKLADGLFDEWAKKKGLFEKTCIVVRDMMATRDWLKSHYLLDSKHHQVLMSLDFVPIDEFVNNWLFAKTHDEPLSTRNPQSHPYAKPVMTWRIYRILLDEEQLVGELAPLKEYVGSDEKNTPRRRFELAAQIARIFDDYLNSRFVMLYKWENGDNTEPDGVPTWQRILYQRLVEENKQTYASDYAQILLGKSERDAIANGFPKYSTIHIFDVPDMPEPTFHLLEKMSEEMDITFWSFNPCGDWLADTTPKIIAIRKLISMTRKALQNGENPPEMKLDTIFDTPRERLLGTLATGGRAVLGAQVDCDWVAPECVLGEPNTAFTQLNRANIAVHSCYSPRRELETVREGLHDFFTKHPDAKPHDALVLCADWDTYAPIIEAVFSNSASSEGYIPISVAGGLSGDTPISRSFNDLLAFRENRFEVSAVFALLGVPAIRARFGLNEDNVDSLLDMVQKANIHWGLDDADVNATVGMTNTETPYPFTWRRGLDRLILDMLYGANDEELVKSEVLGELLPTGSVEGDRARALMCLNAFIKKLAQLREQFASERACTVEEWQTRLLGVIGDFYEDSDETRTELKRIRTIIQNVYENTVAANMTNEIPSDVIVSAVTTNIRNTIPGSSTAADAVVFAPLKSAAATPHRFIWICGLNDGTFPQLENRPSIDVIGKHPSPFDVSSRDHDGFALLKAVLSVRAGCADSIPPSENRAELALSYVGKDIRSNEDLPSSVLLNELVEYLQKVENVPVRYQHPLQVYSPSYFAENSTLPTNYSTSDYRIAEALVQKAKNQAATVQEEAPAPTNTEENFPAPEDMAAPNSAGTAAPMRPFCAFELNPNGETVIPAEDIAEFFAHPNIFLIKKRLNLNTIWIKELEDEETQVVDLDKHLKTRIILAENLANDEKKTLAKVFVEQGKSPDSPLAEKRIEDICKEVIEDKNQETSLHYQNERTPKKGKVLMAKAEDSCDITIVKAYKRFLEDVKTVKPVKHCAELVIDKKIILIPFFHSGIILNTQAGPLEHTFKMEDNGSIYDSTIVAFWIRHLIGHAAGLRFATIMFCQSKGPARTFRPMEPKKAKEFLERYIRLALEPLPSTFPDFDKTSLREDSVKNTIFKEVLQEAESFIVSTHQ